jgi:hypothetical protein
MITVLVRQSIGWSIIRLVGQLVGLPEGWFVVWFFRWAVGLSVVWSVGQ